MFAVVPEQQRCPQSRSRGRIWTSKLTFFWRIGGPQPLSHNSNSFVGHYLGIPGQRKDMLLARLASWLKDRQEGHIHHIHPRSLRLTWTAAASAGGCCLGWTWCPPHSWKAACGSSSSKGHDTGRSGLQIKDLRCGDDLIPGSPNEQDRPLVSAGRGGTRPISTDSAPIPSTCELTSAAGPRCWGSCSVAPCTAPKALKDKSTAAAWVAVRKPQLASRSLVDSRQLSGMTLKARGRRSSKDASSTTALISGYDIAAHVATERKVRQSRLQSEHRPLAGFCRVPLCTCKSSDGPGINDHVAELETQLLCRKLNDHVHGIGLALGER